MFLWRAGPHAGVVALARVAGDVDEMDDDRLEYRLTSTEKFEGPRVRAPLRIETVLQPAVTKARLQFNQQTADLSILRSPQGTNFPVMPAQAAELEQLAAK